jgi:hypothetical protein
MSTIYGENRKIVEQIKSEKYDNFYLEIDVDEIENNSEIIP